MTQWQLEEPGLTQLIELLKAEGFDVVGPKVENQVISYGLLDSVTDLPVGLTDVATPGSYKLLASESPTWFGYNLGSTTWRRFFDPPKRKLWTAQRTQQGFTVEPNTESTRPLAVFGARSCELAALARQDEIYLEGETVDTYYQSQRSRCVIIAVNCSKASANCFCTSTDSGPTASTGFDLCLTELMAPKHVFLVSSGSDKGEALLAKLDKQPVSQGQLTQAKKQEAGTIAQMGHAISKETWQQLTLVDLDSSWWQDVADTCLSCGNCTLSCPTCFCSTVEDTTDLSGNIAERWQQWDSCFTGNFSYIHGGEVRHSTKSRYRQWFTHKLINWQEQFEQTGCVGCGRCITWCPVGIDLREGIQQLTKEKV